MKNSENIWGIRFSTEAAKEYARLPRNDGERITAALDELGRDPYHGDIKKIQGAEDIWRRRIGGYRVLYKPMKEIKTVLIIGIKRRTTTTY